MPPVEVLENPARLATITVASLADNTTVHGQVTLPEALQAAETDAAVDGSTAGSDVDTIVFDASLTSGGDATIQQTVFDTSLHSGEFGPSAFIIGSDVTITGPSGDNRITINCNSASQFRLFHVQNAGSLSLENLSLTSGDARGGRRQRHGWRPMAVAPNGVARAIVAKGAGTNGGDAGGDEEAGQSAAQQIAASAQSREAAAAVFESLPRGMTCALVSLFGLADDSDSEPDAVVADNTPRLSDFCV